LALISFLSLASCSVEEPQIKIHQSNTASESEKQAQIALIDQAGAAVSSQLLLNSMMNSSLKLQNNSANFDGTALRRISENMEPTHEVVESTPNSRIIRSSVDLTSAALRSFDSEHRVTLSVTGHFIMKQGETELSTFKSELTLVSHGNPSSVVFSGNATVSEGAINTELNLSICEVNQFILALSSEGASNETEPCEAGFLIATFKDSQLSIEGRDMHVQAGVYQIDIKHVKLAGDLANPDESFSGSIDASVILDAKEVGFIRGSFDADNSAELEVKLDLNVSEKRVVVDP